MPEIIDFGSTVLAHVESHCELVSNSGMLRVDIGVEFEQVGDDAAMQETDIGEEVRERQRAKEQTHIDDNYKRNREDWQTTGKGFILRCFLNEVTSSLDINWFAVSGVGMRRSAKASAEVSCALKSECRISQS